MANRNVILVDPAHRDSLKPFTWARPLSSIRIGILSIAEKWERRMDANISYSVPEYLQTKFPTQIESENILIQAHLLPSNELIEIVNTLELGEFLTCKDQWLAARLSKEQSLEFLEKKKYCAISETEC